MRSDQEKLNFTLKLIQKGKTYQQIQSSLQEKFGSSLSNSTIKKLHKELKEESTKDKEIKRLRKELELFKELYFQLRDRLDPDDN